MSPTQDQENPGKAGLSNEARAEPEPTGRGKHQKARPSIDVELAQQYKERERLPDFARGRDPRPRKLWERAASSSSGGTKNTAGRAEAGKPAAPEPRDGSGGGQEGEEEEEEDEKKTLKRDATTGRLLAEDGSSCLRCTRKGLRCTLHFFGFDAEPRCAACRRSGTALCVRQRKVQDRVPHAGPPWTDPNFVTGEPEPPARELVERILREHFRGPSAYVQGSYLCAADTARLALPPFNYSDQPWGQRPRGWDKMDWRKVLPLHMNRSLAPRASPPPPPPPPQTRPAPPRRRSNNVPPQDVEGSPKVEELREDVIQFLRISRRYTPRPSHLTEEFPRAW